MTFNLSKIKIKVERVKQALELAKYFEIALGLQKGKLVDRMEKGFSRIIRNNTLMTSFFYICTKFDHLNDFFKRRASYHFKAHLIF